MFARGAPPLFSVAFRLLGCSLVYVLSTFLLIKNSTCMKFGVTFCDSFDLTFIDLRVILIISMSLNIFRLGFSVPITNTTLRAEHVLLCN